MTKQVEQSFHPPAQRSIHAIFSWSLQIIISNEVLRRKIYLVLYLVIVPAHRMKSSLSSNRQCPS